MLSTSLNSMQFENLHFKTSSSADNQTLAEKPAKADSKVDVTSTEDREDARHPVTAAEENQQSEIKQAEQQANKKLVTFMQKNQQISDQIKVLQANMHACRPDSAMLKTSADRLCELLTPVTVAEMLHIQQRACESAEGNTRQRNINQLMADFYHPSIQQESPEEIQERFDLLRFETDLVSLNAADNTWGRDLAQKHWEAIGATRDNYLEVFLNAFEKMNNIFRDFADFKNNMQFYISGPDPKTNKFTVQTWGLINSIERIINAYKHPSEKGHLYPEPGKTASEEECKQWIRQMGLPEKSLQGNATTGYTVRIDLSILERMSTSFLTGDSISATELATWQSGFEAMSEDFQKTMQTFTQKMTSANSLYDNLVKIFSSFIEQDLSAAKGYLNF